jgi:hypothetical protein
MKIKRNELPSVEILNEFLTLDVESGILYWKERDLESNRAYASWNARFANKEAGTISEYKNTKYMFITILCKKYMLHRVIYKMIHGVDPNIIDHINGNSLDNRPSNLRSVTTLINLKNKSLGKNNKSGVIGVRFCNIKKRWRASYNNTAKSFKTFEEAVAFRKEWEKINGYHENHGREINAA